LVEPVETIALPFGYSQDMLLDKLDQRASNSLVIRVCRYSAALFQGTRMFGAIQLAPFVVS